MKIAFIVGRFPALSQTFILRQITGLLDRGHDVDIFAQTRGNEPLVHEEVRSYGLLDRTIYCRDQLCAGNKFRFVHNLRSLITLLHKNPHIVVRTLNVARFGKSALSLGVFRSVAPFIGRGPYDIVHCHFGPLGKLGLLLRDTGILKGRLITSFRGYDLSAVVKRHGERFYDDLFSAGDLFLCVSEHIRAKALQLGCDPAKAIVHRSGTTLIAMPIVGTRKRDVSKTRILTIGRLIEKKGIEYGIEAVAKILPRHPHVEYRIAGGGPLEKKLRSRIDEVDAAHQIQLLGSRTQAQIADLLSTSDILLAPSVTPRNGDEEGIPGVIIEAFAHSIPVVATNHAGIPEAVKDQESGFLVPEGDIDALAQRLEWLIEHPELRVAMGNRGRRFVEQYYDIEKLNDYLVEIYRQLMHGELPRSARQPPAIDESVQHLIKVSKDRNLSWTDL